MRVLAVALVSLLVATALAGCSGESMDPTSQVGAGAGAVDVTGSTGGIRGVVVDSSITPVPNARVAIGGGASTTSDSGGLFKFGNLQPGDYFLAVSKPGYTSVQQAATVVAGVAEPPIVKVVLERIVGQDPFVEHFRLDGFYECGFALPFITDQCDFGVRTVYDEANGTVPGYPAPRNVQQGANTQFITIAPSARTVIQEAFWEDETVARMMVSVDETPIDNACDCSDSYMQVVMAKPTFARSDNVTGMHGQNVAARGFLPFGDIDPANPTSAGGTALNFKFTIVTSVFHNFQPAEGWTFETRSQFPLG